MKDRVETFEIKIEEYFMACIPSSIQNMPDKSFLAEWPLFKFSIKLLYEKLVEVVPSENKSALAGKLIDIKLHYSYLLTINDYFLSRRPTLIVGNNQLDKLNPDTFSLLRGIHYRVFLLAILIEQTLDLLGLIFEGKIVDHKKNKWNRRFDTIKDYTQHYLISSSDAQLLLAFKEKYRTAEFHKFSAVRAMTAKDNWNHLQQEEKAICRLLSNISNCFVGV
jgi:hypothetical protein